MYIYIYLSTQIKVIHLHNITQYSTQFYTVTRKKKSKQFILYSYTHNSLKYI